MTTQPSAPGTEAERLLEADRDAWKIRATNAVRLMEAEQESLAAVDRELADLNIGDLLEFRNRLEGKEWVSCWAPATQRIIDCVRRIQAIRSRAPQRDAREGEWVMVPREPTREMWAAGGNAVVGKTTMHHDIVVEACWRAMIAAADRQAGGK